MLAVIAGEAQMMFSSIVQTVSNIQGGRLRPLATGGAKRSPILPDLPTIAEAGVPDYVAADWWGILAPAGTPAPIVAKLHGAIEDVLRSADTMKNLDQQGATPLTHEFCRIRRLHQIGNGQVGTGGQKSRHESGVSRGASISKNSGRKLSGGCA